MVNSSFLKKMKKGAFLVNTARGPLIESNQLLSKHILKRDLGGVALDVTIDEPPLATDPLIEIWKSGSNFSQNIIINPHTAYYSKHSYKEMRLNAALKVKAILKGKIPKDIIN
jgi:lactate dehydrogenase-like 2-hydroxyacid dehydrogenase